MAGLQEEENQVNLCTESDDEVENISLGVRTKFQQCANGNQIEGTLQKECKVSKNFRPVCNELSAKNACVKHYFGPTKVSKYPGRNFLSDGKMTLVVDDTRFVVDRNIFDSHSNTMLGRYVFAKKSNKVMYNTEYVRGRRRNGKSSQLKQC